MTQAPAPPTHSRPTIWARIVGGDEDALADWFHEQKHPLYAFVYYRVGRDEQLAADVTQTTFTMALERLSEFSPSRGDMQTWLRYLSRNIIRQVLSENRRGLKLRQMWDGVDQQLQAAYERIDTELMPDEVLQRQETRELVATALSNLPPHYRSALSAKYIDGHSLENIAEARGTTIDAVKSLLKRARAAFRDCFLAVAKLEVRDV